MDLLKKVSIKPSVLLKELDGESILLNVETEKYYGLDGNGTHLWEIISEGQNIQMGIEQLLEVYDVSQEKLEIDIVEFLQELEREDLIEFVN